MPNLSISQLTAGGAVSGTDIFPDVQTAGVGPVKVTAAQIGDYVLSGSGLTGVLPVSRGGTGLTSLTAGYIPFGGSTTYGSDSNLFWDNTNKRLGIGTASPSAELDVRGGANVSDGTVTLRFVAASSTGYFGTVGAHPLVLRTNSTECARISADGTFRVKGAGTAGSTDAVQFSGSAPASAMLLDASGNLGLGVTPSAWGASYKAFETTDNSVFAGKYTNLASNCYNDNTNWRYIASSVTATRIDLNPGGGGGFAAFIAASGSAGSTISFTQAMTLDASGNLGVGTSSPSYKLDVSSNSVVGRFNGSSTAFFDMAVAGTTNGRFGTNGFASNDFFCGTTGATPLILVTNNTERGRIDASGNVGINTTAPQFRFNVVQGTGSAAPSLREAIQVYAKGYGGSSTYYSGIGFAMHEHTNGYWGSGILARDDTGSYGSALAFYTSSGSATPTPSERMRIDSSGNLTVNGVATLCSVTATPAGGSTSARLLFGTTAGFGIYYGSGAPTVSAAQGSIYLRSDGSSTSTRLYVNTDGSTTWTNVTTAA